MRTRRPVISAIYVLRDPDNLAIRYVGQTKNAIRREWMYTSLSNNKDGRPVSNWVRKLLNQGQRPLFEVIEQTSSLDDRERFWIQFHRSSGVSLLNLNEGGSDTSHFRVSSESPRRGRPKSLLHAAMSDLRHGIKFAETIGNANLAVRLARSVEATEKARKHLAKSLGGVGKANKVLEQRLIARRQMAHV